MTEEQENLFSLEGKVALVTGASSGLGKHFAKVLAAAGADIAVVARRTEKLDELVKELSDNGTKAFATAMDVTSAASVEEAISTIENELGTVTTLINNAGVADSRHCLKVDEESWDFVMNTNLKGGKRWRNVVSLPTLQVASLILLRFLHYALALANRATQRQRRLWCS